MKIIELINNNTNECETLFIPRAEAIEGVVDGTILSVIGHDEDKLPDSTEYVANCFIKPDGCSHFNFYGEEYDGELDNSESYYHLCGFSSYVQHFRDIVFAYQLAINTIGGEFNKSELNRYEEFCKKLNILEDYSIVERELDESDYLYHIVQRYK